MEKGLPLQCDETANVPWYRFLDSSEISTNHIVCDDDVLLFANSLKKEEVTVASSDVGCNSNFLSLAMETATILDHSNSPSFKTENFHATTLPKYLSFNLFFSTNILLKLVSRQKDMVKSVTVNVGEIVFPVTKLGTTSTLKIPLQNWSSAIQEVSPRRLLYL